MKSDIDIIKEAKFDFIEVMIGRGVQYGTCGKISVAINGVVESLAAPAVANAAVEFPEPLEEVRAKFRGDWDYVEAGDRYYTQAQLASYGQACATAALAAQAPQAALTDDEEQARGEGYLRAMSDIAALLPCSYYMDPPDGGSVTVLEQVERMAKDAERYRYIRNTGTLDTLVWLALEGDGLVNDAGELDEEGYRRGLDRAVDISIVDAVNAAALAPDAGVKVAS